jgi:NAD(P)-dependent dehydrogenase (short-subunit alcohol dehydrogenase family)
MNANKNYEAALITGASGRIGLELARECLELGYRAVIHYRTSPEPAKSFFAKDSDGKRVFFIKAELTESPEKLIEDVLALPIKLVGLINNASVFAPGDMSDTKQFCDILSVNALAPLRLSAAFAKTAGSGWIVNITDARNTHLSKKYQNYRVSKLFLDEITRQSAFLYAPSIRVNAIAPGAIMPSDNYPIDGYNKLAESIPLGKTGDTRSVRAALRFLIENEYITGTIIPADGGWHL